MPAKSISELGTTIRQQIYEIVCGGDASVPPPPDTFLTFLTPGMAFSPDSFRFAAQGLAALGPSAGGNAKAKPNGGSTETPEYNQAGDQKLLLQQAYNWAATCDFVPNVDNIYPGSNQQGTHFIEGGIRLSQMYGQILRASKVVSNDLTEKELAKMEKFRKALRSKRTVVDFLTDEEKEVTEDSPMMVQYHQKMADYIAATLEYNAKRVAAMTANGEHGAAAVLDWAMNEKLYRLKVKTAADAWTTAGYRNEVDGINAFLNHVTLRDMKLWKQRLLEYFEDGEMSGLAPGQRFHYTTLIPGDFATAAGWTNYNRNISQLSSSGSHESSSWKAGGMGSFAGFHFGGYAEGSKGTQTSDFHLDEFGISFDLTQVVLARPWFLPEWFISRGWNLEPGNGWFFEKLPSDGGAKPDGTCIGYPTTALFIRNLTIRSKELASQYKAAQSSIGGGGHAGFACFALAGSYQTAEGTSSFESESSDASIKVPGLQLIGFVNHLLGKTPNPLPELKAEDFE
jgi:hypothetical protein